ncbi:hypothetical protein F4777DRAFT_595707 [Nemania sp. FL0916]|nr:hypothetical protein F4777DRAFT_595707 [Nemania sp. FL0916]
MPSAHDLFKALGPIDWEQFAQEDAAAHMKDIFQDAHSLIDSIPQTSASTSATNESNTNTNTPLSDEAAALRKEWKEVKVNARENHAALSVYKLAAKDGKGAWFARRSVHDAPGFERWRFGMEREFPESLKVQGQPGDGKIRGLGADKRVVDQSVDGCGKMQVYQLSAQFPGPTTARDFVTLCLSSETTDSTAETTTAATTPAANASKEPKSYMLVSKPCVHPECPARQGFIRGFYESVEFIREIRTSAPTDRLLSPEDTTGEGLSDHPDNNEHDSGEATLVEWLMITRSDPGGSVPRFIIEKKTPDGIATDANKFLQWISSHSFEELLSGNSEVLPPGTEGTQNATLSNSSHNLSTPISKEPNGPQVKIPLQSAEQDTPESPGPGGVYGMISGALGMVASAAATRLLGSQGENDDDDDISSPELSDDTSSIHSFHSLDGTEDITSAAAAHEIQEKESAPSISTNTEGGGESLLSNTTDAPSTSTTRSSHYDRELKKLEDKRQKAADKIRRAEERALAKKHNDDARDKAAAVKLREKHERELAKQEEKFQRDRLRLETKRANEERKAEEKRRKQVEKEVKANLTLEIERVRAERDVARKEVEILKEQVGELQMENTKLVARLGREGVRVEDGEVGSVGVGEKGLGEVQGEGKDLARSVEKLDVKEKGDGSNEKS